MATAVVLGAFGAHGLQNVAGITPDNLDTWDTAVLYHLIHSLAVLFLGVLQSHLRSTDPSNKDAGSLKYVFGFFVAGTLLFSGSLYGLVLGAPGWMGPVTPLGGTCLIFGWLALTYLALKRMKHV